MKVQGLAAVGQLYEANSSTELELNNVTVQGVDKHRNGMDVLIRGYFEVTPGAPLTIAAGSSSIRAVFTGSHGAKRGDALRILTTANGIEEREFSIKKIISATEVEIDGIATDSSGSQVIFAIGDTLQLLRGVTPAYTSSGGVITGPVQIRRGPGGVYTDTQVTKDTTVVANTIPLPVEIVQFDGVEVTLTAGDINVQLSHVGANPDVTRIGDGVEEWSINAANEGEVSDSTVRANTTSIDGKMGSHDLDSGVGTETRQGVNIRISASGGSIEAKAQQASVDSIPVVLSTEQETILTSMQTSLTSLAGTVSGTEVQVDIVDGGPLATEVTLSAINTKLPASLGQKARASSLATTLSTEDIVVLTAIQTNSTTIAGAVAGTEMQVDIVDPGPLATEVTLSSLDGKVGSHDLDSGAGTETRQGVSLRISESGGSIEAKGQKVMASSLPVTMASDQSPIPVKESLDVVHTASLENGASNITTAAYVEISADIGATAVKAIQVFTATGSVIKLALGAAAAEVDKLDIPPGGLPGHIMPVAIPQNSRVSLQVRSGLGGFSGDVTTGIVLINFLG